MTKSSILSFLLCVASVVSAQEIYVYQDCDKYGQTVPEGELSEEFSVSATKKVYFSQGNLQYQASTGIWRFAENQCDYLGADNANISAAYDGWIDLFGWGTSGWNSGAKAYLPTSTSTAYADYYPGNSSATNLTGEYANADWGVYNAISNGGNTAGMWRTLTSDEWTYLLSRGTNLRALGTVMGVFGLIILPDDWDTPVGIDFSATISNYTTNIYGAVQWRIMESYGAVFLPAAGYRSGTTVGNAGSYGYYWSSSYYSTSYAYRLYFNSGNLYPADDDARYLGRAVRLVQDVK